MHDDPSTPDRVPPDEDIILDAVAEFIELRARGDEASIDDFVCAHPAGLRERIAAQCRLLGEVEDVFGAAKPELDHARDDERRRIGDFAIERELGRGGWGIVYLAEQLSLRRRVALKVLSSGLTLSRSHLDRFRREAEITSGLDDPGIVTVYEAGSHDGVTYIAMRFVDGSTLSESIASTRETAGRDADPTSVGGVQLTSPSAPADCSAENDARGRGRAGRRRVERVLEVFEKLARSLHTAHEAQLIHRDIKPGNIIVDAGGQPVLLDFGLARHEDGTRNGPQLTLSGDLLGTPAYMSPEQLLGHRVALDRRTDIYSLAVTLYESLTLRLPFEAPTRDALYQKILVSEAKDPRRLNAAIPRDVCTILEVAVEKDRERRYATAADFAEDLRRCRAHEPILARPVGPLVKAMRWMQRRPAVAASLLAMSVVMAVATVVSFGLMRDAAASEGRAVESLAKYERLADLEKLLNANDAADRLFPPSPALAERCEDWLREYGEPLAARLPQHKATLDALMKSAEPVGERVDRADIEARIAKLESQLASLSASTRDSIRGDEQRVERVALYRQKAKKRLEQQIRDLRAEAAVVPVQFASPEVAFRAESMLELVSLLERFVGEDGTLERIRARHRWCNEMHARCVVDHAAAWEEAKRAIASSEHYGGLEITAQTGLIPLGADPSSGLHEFALLRSGSLPRRSDKSGKLMLPRGLSDRERPEDFALVFVLIPGGSFSMGAQRTDASARNYDKQATDGEGPVHDVKLAPYFLSKFEMSQAQWKRLGDGSSPSLYLKLNPDKVRGFHPIDAVTWTQANELLRWHGLTIPTEAQWEHAARARTTTPWSTGADWRSLRGAANLLDRSGLAAGFPPRETPLPWSDRAAHVLPVHIFRPNAFGLHHIHGNVFEFCREWIGNYDEYCAIAAGDGERDTEEARGRVVRGGCFMGGAVSARVSSRTQAPMHAVAYIGIRPARERERPEPR